MRRIRASDISFPDVTFKIVSTEEEMAGAFALLEDSYVRRGIVAEGQMRLQVISLLPSTTTFIAKKGDQILATVSLIEDSDLGLPMEKVHGPEVAGVRQLFRKVAEVGALAVRPDLRRTGLSIMLYNMMYRWARYWRHVDDLLIAVHPSARFFYSNLLLFRPLGRVQNYAGLRGAASLPMRLDIPGVQMRFHRIYRGRIVDRGSGLDFYDFFCAPSDRFDFSAHPEFRRQAAIAGPLEDRAVSGLLRRFALRPEAMEDQEAAALRRHFPALSLSMDGAA
ncbi:GNAT family N-acetyltransferase [Microvirga tunisiensis]|uniref:GNAT family N-acetyltransferase n=2 Tax=Pannonibacter tanglangensis TaxID=2750084 RepID=A0A7X5J8H5_9HYPH|nr:MULTISPECIES: GNAT family N-acetyltransferase [unclassified Pannonibacter]NBN63837.1 GNAT family N-acetyltransferase [Pannonibacter sp. XCT-34]NBN77476.1 GNAT family N-acetyltransferase [Pannonibacter sp. XCT-53]